MNPYISIIETNIGINKMNFISEVIINNLCIFCKDEIPTIDYFGNGKSLLYKKSSNAIKVCVKKQITSETFSTFVHVLMCEQCYSCSDKSSPLKMLKYKTHKDLLKEECNINNCENFVYNMLIEDEETDDIPYYCTNHTKSCISFDCHVKFFGESDLCEIHRTKCIAITQKGNQCKNKKTKESEFCKRHGKIENCLTILR